MTTEPKNHEWREAIVLENWQISRGNFWLKLQSLDSDEIVYQPGNVLSLALTDSFDYLHKKPYTISKSNLGEKTFEHLYKLIPMGSFSNKLAKLRSGDKINFRGIFHKPIHEEISPDVKQIVGISTGTGIGPLYGFAQKILAEKLFSVPITIYAGYREIYDQCLKNELDDLSEEYNNFQYFSTFTQPNSSWDGLKGRVTESVPSLLNDLDNTHFHLVGNGKMVWEFISALKAMGVPPLHISRETYFNHGYSPDKNTIDQITNRFKAIV